MGIFLLRNVFLLATLAFASAQAQPAPPPVVDFVENPMVDTVSISPGGDYIAMVIPRDDHSDLLALDRAPLTPSASLTSRRAYNVGAYWWVKADRMGG